MSQYLAPGYHGTMYVRASHGMCAVRAMLRAMCVDPPTHQQQ